MNGLDPGTEGLHVAEQVVLERIARALGGAVPAAAAAAAAATLRERSLLPDERALVERLAAAQADEDVEGLVLGLRMRAALRTGVAAAGLSPQGAPLPEVLVVRAGASHQENESRVQTALLRVRERLRDTKRGAREPLLLVAAKHLYRKLHALLPEGRKADRATLVFRDPDSADAGTASASIEVVAADVRIDAIERLARESADSVRSGARGAEGSDRRAPRVASTPLEAGASVAAVAGHDPDDDPDDDPLIGELLHLKYRIVRRLGRGGFGAVYEAEDERGAGNRVAIKVLTGAAAKSAAQLQSFKDEARRVTRLAHPNVVDWKVFDETEQGLPYFVMELVEGEEFEETLRREGRLEPMRAAKLLLQILDALRSAHLLSPTESILHLDLKPGNLFLVPPQRGRVEQIKVIDFGIGQYIGDDQVESDEILVASADELDVGPGTLSFASRASGSSASGVRRSLGCTPEYASPEQCAHVLFEEDILALDGRSDLYSLGVIAFELLAGRRPFVARTNRLDVLRMHREDPPPTLASLGVKVPRPLARFVERCLEKDREARFRDAREAYDFLDRFVHPPVAATVAKVTVPLVLVGAALGGWLIATRETPVPVVGLATAAGADLATAPLYLGPERPAAVIDLTGPAADVGGTPGTWSVLRADDGLPAPGWSATWDEPGRVRVEPPIAPGRAETSLVLALSDERLVSRSFTAIWVGAGTWEVSRVDVGGRRLADLGTVDVDPAGLTLDVRVTGPARADLAAVVALVGGGPRLALAPASSSDDQARFRLDLGDAGLEHGEARIELVVSDRAGAEWSRTVDLDVASEPLELRRIELVDAGVARSGADGEPPRCNLSAGRYLLSPRTRPELRVELTRAADVAWEVTVDGRDSAELRGSATGVRRVEADLGALIGLLGDEPFGGRLRVRATDEAYVLRADGSARGLAESEQAFAYVTSEPRFDVQLAADGAARALAPASVAYTSEPDVELRVLRREAVPMRVTATWWPAGRPDEAREASTDVLRNPQAGGAALGLELGEEDGAFELVVRSFRYDSMADAVLETPDFEERSTLVLDRSAPRPLIVGLEPGALLRADDAALGDVRVAFVGAAVEHEAPVDLRWTLTRVAPRGVSEEGAIDGHDPSSGPAHLALPRPWTDGGGDGTWRLAMGGRDRAGNALPDTAVEFDVALTGPAIEVEEPSAVGSWHPVAESGRWRVRLRVRDPNGVGDVRCALELDGDGEPPLAVALEAEATSESAERVLVGELSLAYTMSERSVRLRVHARDAHGVLAELSTAPIDLPRIARALPERVAVSVGGGAVETLVLVRGNAEFPYTFGGRGDALENSAFLTAGLAPFQPDPRRARPRSWQLELPPGAIADYYLDAREVSVGQLAAFLEAPQGYADPAHWPVGAAPSEERRAALAAALAARAADLPATGVRWEEAAAYAHWAGKRLPTWVEWEYAVRGGLAYRPFAAQGSTAEGALASDGDPDAPSGPAPCGRGADITPDGALADLCGNVSEWTATPAPEGYAHQWARSSGAALVRGESVVPASYWAVGGSFAWSESHFAVADARRTGTAHATVGFRCAASVDAVLAAIGREPRPGGPHLQELTR